MNKFEEIIANKQQQAVPGLNFWEVMTLILFSFKLLGFVECCWLLVFLPLFVPVTIAGLFFLIGKLMSFILKHKN